jgi:hypothetical protein
MIKVLKWENEGKSKGEKVWKDLKGVDGGLRVRKKNHRWRVGWAPLIKTK